MFCYKTSGFGNYRVNLTSLLDILPAFKMLSLQIFFKMFGLFRPL